MAEVATRGPTLPSSNPLQFPGSSGDGGSSEATVAIKRKTPSELRGEQLKRKQTMDLVDASSMPELECLKGSNEVTCAPTKPNLSKKKRYADTCMDDLFPSRENGIRLRLPCGKRNDTEDITAYHTDGLKNSSVSRKFTSERQPLCSSLDDSHTPTTSTKEARTAQSYSTERKCSASTFRSVTELSLRGENLSGLSIDMDKAFKWFAARVPPSISAPPESLEGNTNPASAKFCSELHVPGLNIPLDVTLKTHMRVVTSSSVNWFHRLMSCGTLSGVEQFNPQAVLSANQKTNCSGEQIFTGQNSRAKTLHSWVHPQCSLPTSVITALSSSVKQEGQMDFLSKRQLAWETSLRSLYVMLRKNICSIFYVCTVQFVAMFVSGNGSSESTGVCTAYLSQSTRTLRLLLKEQNKDRVPLSDVDCSPESLLAFSGNNNVHGLYDLLLNYRFLVTSLSGYDVPLLYSSVPFENASLSAPEVKCKVRRIDNLPVLQESTSTSEPKQSLDSNSYCTIEIKDAYLTPWIIESVCDTLASNGGDFEASFVTDPMTVGLNVVLDMVCQSPNDKAGSDERLLENRSSFGLKNTIVSRHLSRAFVKSLKYCDRFYTASLSPV